MSTVHAPERPVFNSLDPTLEGELSPPISRLAIVVFLLGFVSLIAVLASSALPLAILIAIIAASVTWKLAGDASVGGLRLAQIGLALAVLSSCWGAGGNWLRANHFYGQGAKHAKLFLDTLSAGNSFEAYEMTLPEAQRQITGTDLQVFYNKLLNAELPSRPTPTEAAMSPEAVGSEQPSEAVMKDVRTKEELTEFLQSSSTVEIMGHGKGAKWEFVRGSAIGYQSSNIMTIGVVMVDSAKPDKKIEVRLNRNTGAYAAPAGSRPVALWEIDKAALVKE